jgi:hypothetical protein
MLQYPKRIVAKSRTQCCKTPNALLQNPKRNVAKSKRKVAKSKTHRCMFQGVKAASLSSADLGTKQDSEAKAMPGKAQFANANFPTDSLGRVYHLGVGRWPIVSFLWATPAGPGCYQVTISGEKGVL